MTTTSNSEKIKETFKRFPFLKNLNFSKACGVPNSSLYKFLEGTRPLSIESQTKILQKLKELKKAI